MKTGVFFEAIVPQPFQEGKGRLQVLHAMERVGAKIKKDFDATVITWTRKPKFIIKPHFSEAFIGVEVFTEDQVYSWVNYGTKPHDIFIRSKKALLFPGVYRAKTSPGVIASYTGEKSERDVFSPYALNVHIEARKFDVVIREKWDAQELQNEVDQAFAKYVEATGYGLT